MSISVLQSYRVKELTEPKVYPCGDGETLQNRLGVLLALPERQLPSHAHFQCSIERVKLSLRSKNVFLYILTGKKARGRVTYSRIYAQTTHIYLLTHIYILYVYTYITLCLNNNNYYNCKVGTTFFLSEQFVTAAVEPLSSHTIYLYNVLSIIFITYCLPQLYYHFCCCRSKVH